MAENRFGTHFVETEALLAFDVDQEEYARRVLADSLVGELRKLARDAGRLRSLCLELADAKERADVKPA